MRTKIFFFCILLFNISLLSAQVTVTETEESIPTYLVGNPELDPYFFNGRVYQGAAGHVYPYPIYDNLTDERVDRDYKYLKLENEYTEISVLPEIGGRIFSASDKQSGYHFFYTQHVIRPALIGMIGSWISGGVEWNIPHHHRASSTLNAGYDIVDNPDGSKTIWVGETEIRQRLKWSIGLTMYPGKSYVEATLKLQNRTPMMQSFLYWANVSVHSNENYQVQFPPQTIYGTTHSKTRYTDWPYNTIYGDKKPTDNSWWSSFTKSNSTFAVNYSQDYLVGYDFGRDAGTAHWANHNLVPGKKFFLWGTQSVWNEMLTEDDGPYLELMVGAFSDNQPDYSWIGPNEVRVTKQYWFPIKKIGGAKNVTLEGAVNVVRKDATTVMVGFNSTSLRKGARVLVKIGDKPILEKTIDIDPDNPFLEDVGVPASVKDEEIFAALYDSDSNELVSYSPVIREEVERPHPADRPKEPAEYSSVEELLLAAQRIEQFHNARLDPMPYYEEALRRDSLDSRVNVNLGIRYAREARWQEALKYLQRAYKRLTGLHYMPEVGKTGAIYQTNPKDGEMLYYLGVVSRALGKEKEAEAYFWKSTWYPGFQSPAYLYLSEMYLIQGRTAEAKSAIDNSISLNGESTRAKFIKAHILAGEGQISKAEKLLKENITFDPLDFLSRVELARIDNDEAAVVNVLHHLGIPLQEVIEISTYYGSMGAYREAVDFLAFAMDHGTAFASTPMQKSAVEPFTASPLLNYMAGYYSGLAGDRDQSLLYYRKAAEMSSDYCFPSRYEEELMLEDVAKVNPSDYKARYYLGNLLYYYNRKDEAVTAWQEAVAIRADFAMAYRNLGFASANYLDDKAGAAEYYHKAIDADSSDPKFFSELDVIEESLAVPSSKRLSFLEKNRKTISLSDEAASRYVSLLVEAGRYTDALVILEKRHFRVWEGGQTVYAKFVDAHLLYGLKQMSQRKYAKALDHFIAAGTFPRNLETNELSTGPIVAKVSYFQGLAYKASGEAAKAEDAFRRCIAAVADSDSAWPGAGGMEESRYYVAMSQKALGLDAESRETIAAMSSTDTAVDVYSKFGEDGSTVSLEARNLYVKGLAMLASGDKIKAGEYLAKSVKLNPSDVWAQYYLKTTSK